MVLPEPAVTTATDHAMATETSVNAPPAEDDGSDNLPDPNVRIQEDLQSLIDAKQKSNYDLQKKSEKMKVELQIEREKNRQLTKDRASFRSNCKSNAKLSVDAISIANTQLKVLAKAQEKSKTESLKAKDVKFKELNKQLTINMKSCKKMMEKNEDLQRTVSRQSQNITNLKGDIMSKIRECDGYKKENKFLTSQVTAFNRMKLEVDGRKMQHALDLKKIELKRESMKMRNEQHSKVLKEKTNVLEHERKLKTIEFTAKTRESGKVKETKRKLDAKLKKFQAGADDMGVLHGELRKQNAVNGGCVPNPGKTSMSDVSLLLVNDVYCTTN